MNEKIGDLAISVERGSECGRQALLWEGYVRDNVAPPRERGDSEPKRLSISIQFGPDIPIIICTGFSAENNEQVAKAGHIRCFLMKSIKIRDVATMIRKVIDESKGITL